MRPRFSDSERIREAAKRNVQTGLAQLKRWWIQKYKLPTTHRLFQEQSWAALNLELTEDLWIREQELCEQAQQHEGSALNEVLDQLQTVRKALGLILDFGSARITGSDPLVDKWERELAEGRDPDLDEVPDG